MSSVTTNLGLLKKSPSTDGNDTFNIETMLNENWDKVDEAVASKLDKKTHVVTIETSQNWTVPAGVHEVMVYLIGGGGGGGIVYVQSSNWRSGAGGKGGCADYRIIPVTPGTVIAIIVGAGGTGGGKDVTPGSAGDTAFGNYFSVKGEGGCAGGSYLSASGSSSMSANKAGADGANGRSSVIDMTSQYKGTYCPITDETYGGGGGSGAVYNDTYQNAGGNGGTGGGGNGGGYGSVNGQDGQSYGAGGGGGASKCNSSTAGTYGTSGAGHAGVCIIAY